MSMIRNIHISFPRREEEPVQQDVAAASGSYSVDIQASEEWIVSGKYRDNSLCALELKRVLQTETKE